MKEIKFRAWHKQQGCMYFTQSSLGSEGDGWIDSIDFEGKKIQLGCQADEGDYIDWFPFEVIELMQFTGLLDKNGKEIYEGDLVKFIYNSEPVEEYRGKVEWNDRDCAWNFDNLLIESTLRKTMEIIGNIYENPTFLK